MDEKYKQKCKKAEEILLLLEEKIEIEELKAQVCQVQERWSRAMQMNNLKSIVNALSHNLDFR